MGEKSLSKTCTHARSAKVDNLVESYEFRFCVPEEADWLRRLSQDASIVQRCKAISRS